MPPRLSIVVLPFANLSDDREQDYFVDGVTESLTTDLSRISGSFVIARNSAFSYKGRAIDVRQVGRGLNVRYVAELLACPNCYPNIDFSTTGPRLNVRDFITFLNRFTAGDADANCDQSTNLPGLDVLDFSCFLNKFAAGCP